MDTIHDAVSSMVQYCSMEAVAAFDEYVPRVSLHHMHAFATTLFITGKA